MLCARSLTDSITSPYKTNVSKKALSRSSSKRAVVCDPYASCTKLCDLLRSPTTLCALVGSRFQCGTPWFHTKFAHALKRPSVLCHCPVKQRLFSQRPKVRRTPMAICLPFSTRRCLCLMSLGPASNPSIWHTTYILSRMYPAPEVPMLRTHGT